MNHPLRSNLIAVCLLGFFTLSSFARESKIEPQPIGKKIEQFELKDYRGKTYKLSDFADSKAVVLAFIGCECPVAKRYTVTLQKLAEEFKDDGVTILAIDANQHDSITEMAGFAKVHSLEIPFLKDLANRLADQVGARRTPEVILLDQSRTIQYRGRIDDHFLVGNVREGATRDDLKIALEEVLNGQQVTVPETDPVGCHIGRILEADESSEVTYSNQVARILQNRCVECHREGEIAPFALTDYDEVVGWSEMIAEVVEDQRMPPWHADPKYGHFSNDRSLSEQEKTTLLDWVEAGAPEGDPKQLPEPKTYVKGWSLPEKPDLILDITETGKAASVPAEGEVEYKYIRVDPGFEKDVWIKGAELRPGNLQVVHHILCFAIPPGTNMDRFQGGARSFLVGYVPGKIAENYPKGMAKRIPAKSTLIFQMHYTPNGSPQEDLSQLGLSFIDEKEVKYEIHTTSALQRRIDIPPGDGNHEEIADSPRSKDDNTVLLGFMPHMHLRGKSFRYMSVSPAGEKEILIDIPQYDFNWQTAYMLSQPRKMPKGSYIHAIAHYDNSKKNLFNPDPTKTVHWGDQTSDEMMIGYFDVAVPKNGNAPDPGIGLLVMGASQEDLADRSEKIVQRFDRNGDGIVQKAEVNLIGIGLFNKFDQNSDGEVTLEEVHDGLEGNVEILKALRSLR
ncbi:MULTISPECIES: redoxin domain-containing protein [Pirellulaceae]|uniref:redoxin domain-containing protein n=1 Tax=Pirellulaceae TaxID=2691357 RepID=UPI0018ED6991|nr:MULTISPECIES: redoxin domain-containing protein [Pirellulaceae]